MHFESEELGGNIACVTLVGSLDLAGAEKIDLKLTVLAKNRKHLLIDLEQVDFLASMGIRSLISAAKSLARQGGKLALIKPAPTVLKVLTTTGLESLMPIFASRDDALAQIAG